MSGHLRIGLLYASGELSQSISEQRLGTRLAVEHTRQLWSPSDGIELVEREVAADSLSVEETAADLLHNQGCEFQRHAAACTVDALAAREVATRRDSVPDAPSSDRELLERMRTWDADAICILGSELERLVELVKAAQQLGSIAPMLHARGLLCREFAELAGEAGEGHEFTDLYLRDARASREERELHRRLAKIDPELVATASHGFGWDGLRLLARQAVGRTAREP